MTDTPTLDSMAPTAPGAQFAQLESRLVEEYGSDQRDVVHRLVEQERDRFADASVHAFVPILIERSVRTRLDTGHA